MSDPITAKAIILSGKINPASQLIMLRTRSLYSHSAILLSDDTVVEALAIPNQVQRNPRHLDTWLYWEEIIPIYLPYKERYEIASHSLSHVGDKYDWRAFRGHIDGDHENDPNRFICFEFIGHLLENYFVFGRKPEEMTSHDLENLRIKK